MAIKVLVVDDHDLVRIGISRMLGDVEGIKVVGQAASGEEAVRLVRELSPDVVLMDVQMPGIGGLEATRKIQRIDEGIRVIAVTVCDEEPFPSRLLKAGAAGYLTKGADLQEMVRAIRVVSVGQKYISAEIAQQMALKPFKDEQASPFDQLSERELQISIMVVNCQKVQEISDKLCLSPKTVNSYRYRIFEKLGIDSDVELTLLAVRHGLVDARVASGEGLLVVGVGDAHHVHVVARHTRLLRMHPLRVGPDHPPAVALERIAARIQLRNALEAQRDSSQLVLIDHAGAAPSIGPGFPMRTDMEPSRTYTSPILPVPTVRRNPGKRPRAQA